MAPHSAGVAVLSETGREGGSPKPVNQDTFLVDSTSSGLTVVGVFDGHGRHGHFASRHVAKSLQTYLQQRAQEAHRATITSSDNGDSNGNTNTTTGLGNTADLEQQPALLLSEADAQGMLQAGFKETATSIKMAHLRRMLDVETSGSTACMCAVLPNSLVVAHVGDTRAVVGVAAEGGGYTATFATKDHKPGDLSERARIVSQGGRVSQRSDKYGQPTGPFRVVPKATYGSMAGLAVSRAFGDLHLASAGVVPTPDITVHPCSAASSSSSSSSSSADVGAARAGATAEALAGRPRELLVVGTDGLWDMVGNEEAVLLAAEAGHPEAGAQALMETAKARWAASQGGERRDDITVTVVYL
ncbi:hypothetical protein N2152v2_004530 [Parachlorella kessleri]